MKDKIILYALGILIIVILGQNVQVYLLNRKVNTIFDKQVEELEQLKEQNLIKADSIEFFKKRKLSVITKKEKSFYDNVNKAKENNIRYEQIKKDISNNNDADSLARELSKRYPEEG